MTCEAVQALISAYIDGELMPYEKEQVERHLSDCALCLRECHSLSQTKRLLLSMPDYEAPEELVLELTDMAEENYARYPGQEGGSLARFWRPAVMAGLSFAAVVFAALWFLNLPGHENKNSLTAVSSRTAQESINLVKQKVDFEPVMPDSLPEGYEFDGASVFNVSSGKKIAHFGFTNGRNSFYLSEGRTRIMPEDAQIITLKDGRKGHLSVGNRTNILYWESQDVNFTLMGDVPHQTLINTADSFR